MMSVIRAVAVAASLAIVSAAAAADTYPSKPIRLIVPLPPGGPADIMARTIAQKLGDALGQQVVVDNRAGASGNTGTELAARAPADGYTLVLGYDSTLATNLALMGSLPYDPVKDFVPISLVASSPSLLVVNPSLPVKTVKELVELAKQKPGSLNYATAGNGSGGHLAGERLKKVAGIDIVHIPYKGGAPAALDLVAGKAQLSFMAPGSAEPYVKSGQLRMLAVSSDKRWPLLPDVPTMAEAGYPDFVQTSWWGILAPAGTPKEIVAKLNAEITKILADKEVKNFLVTRNIAGASSTPEEFAAFIATEIPRWTQLVKDAGAKIE